MSKHQLPYPLIAAAEIQLTADQPILKAMEVIERSVAKMALVIDVNGRVIGSLTDGDVRRALLKNCTLQSPVSSAMHTSPYVLPASSTRQQIIDTMLSAQIKQIPLIEADGKLLGIALYDMLTGFNRVPRSNPVVIMAGGKGKRMLPFTKDIPKPMLEVGGKPMLQHIIEHFIRQGFSNFHVSVNYLGDMIEDFFGDGSKWNCHIDYIHEPEFLGTAGALALIDKKFTEPFFVINGDILTSVDFCDLLGYHITSNSSATVCARQHRVEVPFGVIQIKDGLLQTIVEKPVYEDLVSAGIYVFNPEILGDVPANKLTDMPDLLLSLVKGHRKVAVFPMREDWVDVGRYDDWERAKQQYTSDKA